MAIGEIIAGAVQGLANTGLGIWQTIEQKNQAEQNLDFQKEQFDYQKSLQQQIFDREDTAVARRVADLEASGLNKNLAVGSPASAGSVVSTTAPQGSSDWTKALDNLKANADWISAIEQIKQARLQTAIMQRQEKNFSADYYNKLAERSKLAEENLQLQKMNYAMDMQNDLARALYEWQTGNIDVKKFNQYSAYLTPYINALNADNAKTDIIKKENKWYNTNQIFDVFGTLNGIVNTLKK